MRRHNVLLPEDKTRLGRLDVEVPESSFSSSEGLRRVILELGGAVRAAPETAPETPGSRRGRPELPRPFADNSKAGNPVNHRVRHRVPGLGGLGLDRGSRAPGRTSFTIFTSYFKCFPRL